MVVYCPRCGARDADAARFCFMCSDGIADERDWNTVLGTPRWLQSDETPDEPGWRPMFQYTAYRMGREMGDGAECYGMLHDDGRGRFFIQSH